MKQVRGVWLPDSDDHIAREIGLDINPMLAGKGTYQLNKYRAAYAALVACGGQLRHAVDVGAHVGLWSRVMAMDFERVTAIEPLAMHRECFTANVEGVELFAVALGAVLGVVNIGCDPRHTGAAHVGDTGETVDVVTIDSLQLWPVDFMKIDIEGYEYEAVKGGEQTIRDCQPVIVIEQKPDNAERYGRGQWDAVELLRKWGMRDAEVIGGDHVMVWG